jgi:hypothetical protein
MVEKCPLFRSFGMIWHVGLNQRYVLFLNLIYGPFAEEYGEEEQSKLKPLIREYRHLDLTSLQVMKHVCRIQAIEFLMSINVIDIFSNQIFETLNCGLVIT